MDDLEAIRARKLEELKAYATQAKLWRATKPVHLTDLTFDAEVLQEGVLLVDFWAAWCAPCLRIAPMIEQLAVDYAGKARVGKLNVDENPATAERFGVQSIPTLLMFKDGKLVDQIVGAVARPVLERALSRWT